jgi:hypothetical protein
MRWFVVSLFVAFTSCEKVITVQLPPYEPELVIEMYLEEGKALRCALTESVPYTDTAIVKPVNDALVVFSDGSSSDTLSHLINKDNVNGRIYNYFNPRVLTVDTNKVYSITVTAKDQTITATTSFYQKIPAIDSLNYKESENEVDSFSVGFVITDPGESENYYRFLIGKDINYFRFDPTDFRVSDKSFNGNSFSFFSESDFARLDTVTVRVYSLHKDHFEYLESIGDARRSNFNPLSQPSRIKSNVTGGLGIFTTIRYRDRRIIIR